MDFGLYPPEINSGRMYAGPGSGPMLAAAAAWDALAAELHSTATSYGSVISELSAGPWLGAASAAMTAAAAPYLAWMRSTASQAEQTAIQAKSAAAAYEGTFAAMGPPPALAATETLYAEMWAQDATAMYGYAGASASATTLPPFTPAPQTTNGTSATAASQATSTALQGVTSTAATNATSASALDTLSDLSGITLFLPGVATTGLTPLNTTGLFTDLTFDDDELRDGALKCTEDKIAAKLGITDI